MSVTKNSLCTMASDCASTDACDLIQDCGSNTYCVSDGPACPTTCKTYDGYCSARDVCSITAYALTPSPESMSR